MTRSADEAVLREVVGAATLARGLDIVRSGAVVRARPADADGHVYGEVRGTGKRPYSSIAKVSRAADGVLTGFRGTCTCPVGSNCKHAVALVLAAGGLADPADRADGAPVVHLPTGQRGVAAWERALAGLVPPSPPPAEEPVVAIQFELGTGRARGAPPAVLRMRPVLRGRGDGWVRTGVSWSGLGYLQYARRDVPADHLQLLREIAACAAANEYYAGTQPIDLTRQTSARVLDLVAEAQALGVPLVLTGRESARVSVRTEPAQLGLDLHRSGDALVLRPQVTVDGRPLEDGGRLLLGQPPHAIVTWGSQRGAAAGLAIARFAAPVGPALADLLEAGRLRIPARDEQRFLGEYYPALRRQVPVASADGSVPLPEPDPPQLTLVVEHRAHQHLQLQWRWRYRLGTAERVEPLWPPAGGDPGRDHDAEAAALATVGPLTAGQPALHDGGPAEARLRPEVLLAGIDAARFCTDVAPGLAALPDLEITTIGVAPDYRAAASAPVITVTADRDPGPERDWFDLAVTVHVDDEPVPFEQLFRALAAGEAQLLLPSGTYFALDRPELGQLADLIAEARALRDAPPGALRLSRFQASMWDELEALGVLTGQAAQWQQSVRARLDVEHADDLPVPGGLRATLRPYQRAGLTWLAALRAHGLGGVLADEMGLGKTLQALALIVHVHESDPAPVAPFLVVAPTSVVPNWVSECQRFAPGLTVRSVTGTAARRGGSLAEWIAGADVVVTSYALLRLEHEQYLAHPWAGLFLDEAQFAKNHQSRNYGCTKQLPVPFKVAITGTPLENNLTELWSLLSITAPGLFPVAARFAEFYRKPIEKGDDPERLALLRRRIAPLMLRRSKREVLSELPDKQEQVLELELNARHDRIYQTHLHRERQKVLGLLDDLEGNRFEIFRSLTLLRQACLDPALVDDRYAGVPATKLDALLELLTEIGPGHRTLVFSQFTRFLAAAARRLDAAGIAYSYLDGRTRDRAAVLEDFKQGDAPVFLISLKAGGFGLNLTEADYCVLLDPWWNPATEAQAVDRVHRIGQRNKVMVYRLVAKDTIEDKVMALKQAKATLFDSVLGDAAFSAGRLQATDIQALLE